MNKTEFLKIMKSQVIANCLYLTVTQVAELEGKSVQSIYQNIRRNLGSGCISVGGWYMGRHYNVKCFGGTFLLTPTSRLEYVIQGERLSCVVEGNAD